MMHTSVRQRHYSGTWTPGVACRATHTACHTLKWHAWASGPPPCRRPNVCLPAKLCDAMLVCPLMRIAADGGRIQVMAVQLGSSHTAFSNFFRVRYVVASIIVGHLGLLPSTKTVYPGFFVFPPVTFHGGRACRRQPNIPKTYATQYVVASFLPVSSAFR